MISYEDVKNYVESKETGNGCKLLSKDFVSHKFKIDVMCACGNTFSMLFGNFKKSNKCCKECSKIKRSLALALSPKIVKEYINGKDGNGCRLLSEYEKDLKKMEVKCACENIFMVKFSDFKKGQKQCPKCGNELRKNNYRTPISTIQQTVEQSGYFLLSKDYGQKTEYKIKIKCVEGHEYETLWEVFKNGHRCRTCAGLNKKDFKKELYELVGSEYSVLEEYKSNKTKIKLKHNTCGHEFKAFPNNVLIQGTRCPICNGSKGEIRIQKFLFENKILYQFNEELEGLVSDKNYSLKFDFIIYDNEKEIVCIIEYNGLQHYQEIEYFGGLEYLLKIQSHDKMKRDYCKTKNIILIDIDHFDFNNIETILTEKLTELGLLTSDK